MHNEEQTKKISQLIAKCWADDAFKQTLIADPATTLKAEGIDLAEGITVSVVENTDTLFHVVIPAKPGELSDEALDLVAGAKGCSASSNGCASASFIP